MRRFQLLGAGLLLVACANEPGADEGAQSEGDGLQIAAQSYRLELEPGHFVDYDLGDRGELSVEESGQQGVHEVASELVDLSHPSEVFLAFHPGQAVPDEIRALEEALSAARVDGLPEGEGQVAAEATTPAAVVADDDTHDAKERSTDKHATSDANHFIFDHFGCWFGSEDIVTSCLTNRTGGGTTSGNARWAFYKTAPYRGSIKVRRWYNGNLAERIYEQGSFHYAWARGGLTRDCHWWRGCSYYFPQIVPHKVEVSDADGDGYHRSVRMHNYKLESVECAEQMQMPASSDTLYACQSRY